MVDLASPSRDTVTNRDKSHDVTLTHCGVGERDGRDTHPIGGVTLSHPPIRAWVNYDVEPLPVGQAWVRGDHSWRQKVSLRPCDMRWTFELMRGTGATPATYLRYLVQRGIAVVMAEAGVS